MESCLRGALFHPQAVAGLRARRLRGRAYVFQQPRAALRPDLGATAVGGSARAVTEGLRQRILTAAVLVVALLAVLLALAGAWEWSAFLLRGAQPALRAGYVLLVGVLLYASWQFSATAQGRDLLLGVAVLWWLVALLSIALAPQRVTPWAAAAAGLLALVPSWLALVRLRLAVPDGAQWTLFVLLLVWVADIGAFFSGRRFGRIRLAPE